MIAFPLSDSARWSATQSDALSFLRAMPSTGVDLVLFSPPYEDARQYGEIRFKLRGESWVQWMRQIVREAARVSKGLVIVNAAGKVRNWKYSPIMELLTADLIRQDGLVCGPAPYAWVKAAGIPGSGSTKYQRRDWEPVYAYAEPKKLPVHWSDNTAFGHPPKWSVGGEMSHRLSDGTRRNQWGGTRTCGSHTRKNGFTQRAGRPSHRITSKGAPCGTGKEGDFANSGYTVPALANPGNVIRTKVGGGQLGHRLAHENEAPFPVSLVERFIRWFCPPCGVVLDPFAGSGSTGHAALIHGRRFLGCDLRQDQVELSHKRLAEVEDEIRQKRLAEEKAAELPHRG